MIAIRLFARWQIAMFAEPEFDGVASAVDRSVKVHPLAANLDVGLVHMPLAADCPLAPVEVLELERDEIYGSRRIPKLSRF